MIERKGFAEFLGTAFLLIAVVGSGIMGERLSQGNLAVALLANSIATGAALFVLITVFGTISGAHFNPIVTIWACITKKIPLLQCGQYICFQLFGAIIGVWICHFIFELPVLQFSTHLRNGLPQGVSETLATFGLLLTIFGFSKNQPTQTPSGVALYITGAYWFTASTSFANPAVTLARMFTDTFAGIAPESAPVFILFQFIGLLLFIIASILPNCV
jgi:glycerol uptake facilitator-like aquaporin